MRLPLITLVLALVGCADSGPAATVPLDGAYSGGNGIYSEVRLTLVETEDGLITGTLLLRDGAGETVFDGSMAGRRVGPSGFELAGGRPPSVGGGTVDLQGTRAGTAVQVVLSSSWLPSTTIGLQQQPGLQVRVVETDVHVFEMTSEVAPNGHYVLRHHTLVTFRFSGATDIRMAQFNNQNVLMGLGIKDITERQR